MTGQALSSGRVVLAEVIPAIGYGSEHHRAKREALFAEIVHFISETGDGEFAVLLGNALQFLPEAVAHQEHCLDLDTVVTDSVTEQGFKLRAVDLVRHKKVLSLLGSAGLHLTLSEVI